MAGEPLDSGMSQLQMQALTQHLERIMKQQSDGLHERLDQMEQAQQVMANFMKVFLNHVRYGAEAMYECVQDPPKSGVDLEGA